MNSPAGISTRGTSTGARVGGTSVAIGGKGEGRRVEDGLGVGEGACVDEGNGVEEEIDVDDATGCEMGFGVQALNSTATRIKVKA